MWGFKEVVTGLMTDGVELYYGKCRIQDTCESQDILVSAALIVSPPTSWNSQH